MVVMLAFSQLDSNHFHVCHKDSEHRVRSFALLIDNHKTNTYSCSLVISGRVSVTLFFPHVHFAFLFALRQSLQDTFLPHVECGTITLIGATTENPSFQVNSALLSRCRVLVLERLSVEAMGSILDRAVAALGIRVQGREIEDQDQSDEQG